MKNRLAFLITTFLRDELLYKSVQSLIDNLPNNSIIIIADQENPSDEKSRWVFSLQEILPNTIYYQQLPFDCGLSFARNRLVEWANELNCKYCFLSSDSFLFNESIKLITPIIKDNLYGLDLIGIELKNSVCAWEAKLNLIEGKCFELDFINKSEIHYIGSPINLWNVDICRNIFIATTDSLSNTKWDENLKLGEHEDFFWRYKLYGYKCGWTNNIYATKLTDRPTDYAKYRKLHFNDGLTKLRKKYEIIGWVEYKHLERSKT